MSETPYEIRARWKTRRRMAWIAFLMAVTYPIQVAIWPHLAGITAAFLSFCGSVVVVYIGGAVVDDYKSRGPDG